MTLARRFAAAAALATVATLSMGGAANATAAPVSSHGWDHHDGSLGNASENNIGPAQACNNNVAVNVLGVQGAVDDLAGVVGFDNDGNGQANTKVCDQESMQDN